MSATPAGAVWQEYKIPAVVIGLGVAFFLAIRLQVAVDDFPNPDIAGIVYNAQGLLLGKLPYRDIVEIKPPGAFYLAAASIAAFGRGLAALQWFHTLWLLVGAPAMWFAVVRGRSHTAAIAVAIYLFYAAMFAFNYSSWMLPLYAWAVAAILRSVRGGGWRWALAAGACSAWATLTIQRAVVLGVFALVLWVLTRRTRPQHAPTRLLAMWLAGAVLGAFVFALPFLLAGEAASFVHGVLPLATVSDYTAATTQTDLLATAGHASWQLVQTFPAALVLAALALGIRMWRPRPTEGYQERLIAVLLLVTSMLGAGLGGGRFYLHYLPQYIPAIALLAADPALLAVLRSPASRARRAVVASALTAFVLAATWQVSTGNAERFGAKARRLQDGTTAAQSAGAHIRANSAPNDRVYAWGWTAWRVYYWAQQRAPGGVYKSLGTLTTYNTNTAFANGAGPQFRPGPAADAFIAAFDQTPPAFVVLSPSYVSTFGSDPDPLMMFPALRLRLERDYKPDAKFGDLMLLRRNSPLSRQP